MKVGKVYLVGGGPGAPELITVRGRQLLGEADVIVYDRLVDERLIAPAKPGAELIYAGKASGHGVEQAAINELLVAKAREGKMVVRLKGGDPFVLGRGGEEAEFLVQNGIPFEVVPGVTAAIAAPAYAGIPVTHRGLASSFAVVTGHEDPTKPESSLAWDRLATAVDTLVFLMGMDNLAAITEQLVKHGRPATTPVALIRWGTSPHQETLVGTLGDIAYKAREASFGPPVVAIIGPVVSLREKLRWFDTKPLFGKRILVTRSRSQASALYRLLAQEGAEPVELPTIEIQPLPSSRELKAAIGRLSQFHWIIFTSASGVEVFFTALSRQGRDARALGGLQVCAIGEATATALKKYGIAADLVPQDYSSQGILEVLKGKKLAGLRFLLPRADLAGQELARWLAAQGVEVEQVVAYHTIPARKGKERAREVFSQGVDAVTFTSSSTVRGLVNLLGGDLSPLKGSLTACIGPVTAATAEEMGLKVDIVAQEHTIPGLVKALVQAFQSR